MNESRKMPSHRKLSSIVSVLLFALILSVGLSVSQAGTFWGKVAYFPNPNSLPEDPWELKCYVELRTLWLDRMSDLAEKEFLISIKTRQGDRLYSEIGKTKVGFADIFIQWKSRDSVSLVIKTEAGKIVLTRDLEYDPVTKAYKQSIKSK